MGHLLTIIGSALLTGFLIYLPFWLLSKACVRLGNWMQEKAKEYAVTSETVDTGCSPNVHLSPTCSEHLSGRVRKRVERPHLRLVK